MFLHKYFSATVVLLLAANSCVFAQTFGTYKNTAVATATASGSVQVSDISNDGSILNQPSGLQTPINFPMIGLGKTASAPVIQNDGTYNVDYTFTIKNFGQVALQNVQVRDLLTTALPSPLTYTLRSAISIAGGTGLTVNTLFDGTPANQNLLVAASSTLAIGKTRTLTVPLNVNLNGTFGTYNNTASASATTADNTAVFDTSNNSVNPDGNGDGNPFNDAAPTPLVFNSPDIQVLKTVNNLTPMAGSNVTFTVTAKNNGPGDAANVMVNDLLNAMGYTFVSAATTAGTYNAATGVWSVGNLANSISRTLNITAKVLYSKPLSAYVNTAGSNYLGDNTPANNSATVNVTPVQVPPDAVNDAVTGVAATANATLNLLANDLLAGGTPATLSTVTVDIDLATAGVQTTLNVNGQGSWTYNTSTGDITFSPVAGFTVSPTAISYILTENATGLSDQATVTVTKAANTDVTLRSLVINTGTLSPAFTSSNPNYMVTVPYTTASINLGATANDANATVSINNTAATSGSASNTIALNVGANAINVVVTAQDGISTQAYTVTVTRDKAPQVITVAAITSKTFGDADFPLGATSNNNGIPVTYLSDNPAVATIINGNIHVVGTGTVNFTASQQGDANYSAAADVIRSLTVNAAAQTISFTAPATAIYGDASFVLNATASSGLPVTFSSADASIASVGGATVTIHKAGTVILTALQTGNANYNAATAVSQTLTINPKTLTAALNGTISKVYDGNANAVFTGINYGLSAKIAADDVTLNYPATGIYNDKTVNSGKQVSVTGLSLSGTAAANYVLAATALTANIGTITPAGLTVNLIGAVGKVYDGSTAATLTAANYQLLGLIGNDLVNFTKPTTGIYDNSNAASGKTVTVNNIVLSGADAGNYSLAATTINNNIGVITAKNLTVTADNQTKIYGAANPALSLSYSGFVNGESSNILTTQPAVNTPATNISDVGSYPINVSGAATTNYQLTYVNGVLTVGQSSQTITFAALSAKIYGDADFSLTATASSNLPVVYSSSNPAVATVNAAGMVHVFSAGNTTITAGQTGNNNYTGANPVTQMLTVNKALLTITADAQTKIYGAANPALTVSYSGFVNGDTNAVFSTQPTVSTLVTTVSPAGTYPVTAGGAAAANYNISYGTANFTVVKAALTITAENKSRFFGLANPALTAGYSGFVNGDNPNSFTVLPVIATTATANSAAGTYPIVASGAVAANYNITYVPGTLTITNATVNSISFSAVNLLENQLAGTLAGTFSTISLDPNATYTYSLITGNGAVDNALFRISGNQLLTTQSLDYEQKPVYSVLVRATNQYGLFLDQSFAINLTDVNEAPTLAAIQAQQLCYTTATRQIRLTNVTAGPETTQNVTLSVSSSNLGLFNDLKVSAAVNGTATLSYQLATIGTTTITVTVKDNGGTANGGTDSFSQTFTLTANDLPIAEISSDKGIQISKGETVTLTAAGGGTYSWNTTPNVSGSSSSAIIRVRPEQTTTYQVVVSNGAGCSSIKSITIDVADDYSMIQPANILTPNGDGQNDTWIVKNIDLYPNNTISIYDKGGRKLIEVKHYDNRWDGTLNGAPLTEGTYYYVIDFGEGKGPKKGFITILRNR